MDLADCPNGFGEFPHHRLHARRQQRRLKRGAKNGETAEIQSDDNA
jgi:hypothetical protein